MISGNVELTHLFETNPSVAVLRVARALDENYGHVTETAAALHVSRSTLNVYLTKYPALRRRVRQLRNMREGHGRRPSRKPGE